MGSIPVQRTRAIGPAAFDARAGQGHAGRLWGEKRNRVGVSSARCVLARQRVRATTAGGPDAAAGMVQP
jgi:hypothetical protein